MTDSSGSRTGRGTRSRAWFAMLCLVALTGCYTTTELRSPTPEPGTRIVAELTPVGTVQMEPLIGAEAVGVEARVLAARPEEWELSLLRVAHRGVPGVQWSGERVVFPAEVLRGTRERRLDALRTAAFTVGVGTLLVVLARNFMWAAGGSDNGGPGPDPVH